MLTKATLSKDDLIAAIDHWLRMHHRLRLVPKSAVVLDAEGEVSVVVERLLDQRE